MTWRRSVGPSSDRATARGPAGDRESQRWALRGRLELAGLRVVTLLPVPDRPGRWFAQVLADGVTRDDLRRVRGVVRVSISRGSPRLLTLTVDAPSDDTAAPPAAGPPEPGGAP